VRKQGQTKHILLFELGNTHNCKQSEGARGYVEKGVEKDGVGVLWAVNMEESLLALPVLRFLHVNNHRHMAKTQSLHTSEFRCTNDKSGANMQTQDLYGRQKQSNSLTPNQVINRLPQLRTSLSANGLSADMTNRTRSARGTNSSVSRCWRSRMTFVPVKHDTRRRSSGSAYNRALMTAAGSRNRKPCLADHGALCIPQPLA